jgi:16S rRNA (cytosine967-C5)-methyltransferase
VPATSPTACRSQAGVLARTPWAPGAPALAAAASVVEGVIERGESAEAALDAHAGERAVRAVALGTLRWYLRLAPALESLLPRPAGVPGLVRALLAVAAHQVQYSRNVPESVVHTAVDATRILRQVKSTGLVNAVLRRFVAERAALLERVDATPAGRTAHPRWLVERIGAAWGERTEAILAGNNARAPMALRVDLSRTSAPDYVASLAGAGIDAHPLQWMPSAVILERPMAVTKLPGFLTGEVSVQDAGAQLAVPLLDVRAGMRVLDACAAPGGKTGHLLEVLGEGADLTALDVDAGRLSLIAENLQRLRRHAQLVAGDAADPATLRGERAYERILVDAPCSASGVIRRHPDIKLLRRPSDLATFAQQQLAILRCMVGKLAPGGRLVYSTCSVLPEENERLVAALLEAEPSLAALALPLALAPGALACTVGGQLLPGAEAGTDGFYYACLEKTTART